MSNLLCILPEMIDLQPSQNQAIYGNMTGTIIWLTNVTCSGTEKVLMNCTSSMRGNSSCTHDQDVSVRCLSGEYV